MSKVRAGGATPPFRIPVTQQQFEKIEDAWYLASYPSGRKISDPYWTAMFRWAVEQVTGVDVRKIDFALEIIK